MVYNHCISYLQLTIRQAFKKWSFSPSPFLWSYLLAQLLVPTIGVDIQGLQQTPVVGMEKNKVQDGNTLVSTASQNHAPQNHTVNQSLETPSFHLATSATPVQRWLEGWWKTILHLRWNQIDKTRKENLLSSEFKTSSISIVINCIARIFITKISFVISKDLSFVIKLHIIFYENLSNKSLCCISWWYICITCKRIK